MFQDKLKEYNKLFDEYKEIERKYSKLEEEKCQPFLNEIKDIEDKIDKEEKKLYDVIYQNTDELDKDTDESDEDTDELYEDSYELDEKNKLEENLSFDKFGLFEGLDNYKSNTIKKADAAIDIIEQCVTLFPNEENERMLESLKSFTKKIESLKSFLFFPKFLFGISLFLSLFMFMLITVLGGLIACSLGFTFLGISIVIYICCKFRQKRVLKIFKTHNINPDRISSYIKLINNCLNEEKRKIEEKYKAEEEIVEGRMKEIVAENYNCFLNETKEIRDRMGSYDLIDKGITKLLDCFKNNINCSSDYMKLFEENFNVNFENEEDFLKTVRDIIEKKVREEEQRAAVSELCDSCKHRLFCSLRDKLTSPVCSKYEHY